MRSMRAMRALGREPPSDPLAALLLPGKLEGFALEAHARGLLAIPRVVALEYPRLRLPGFLRDSISLRQAARLRLPGRLRLLVLYHPAQYPFARALMVRDETLELWYVPPDPADVTAAGKKNASELLTFDELAREHARQLLPITGNNVDDAALRARLRELGVIDPHAFLPRPQPRWRPNPRW